MASTQPKEKYGTYRYRSEITMAGDSDLMASGNKNARQYRAKFRYTMETPRGLEVRTHIVGPYATRPAVTGRLRKDLSRWPFTSAQLVSRDEPKYEFVDLEWKELEDE